MAIRVIRTEEDPVLRKISKPVKEVTPKIITLIDDMLDGRCSSRESFKNSLSPAYEPRYPYTAKRNRGDDPYR